MMNDIKNTCRTYASKLPYSYETGSIDDMLSGYRKYRRVDGAEASKYISGLILRFWFKIGQLYQQHNSDLHLEFEDYYSFLVDAIELACDYGAWENPEKKVNGQQALNQCISTIMLRYRYQTRLDKHKAQLRTTSIDTPVAGDTDGQTIGDTLIDDYGDPMANTTDGARCLIQYYIDNKKIVEAIILDTIANNDTFKHTKKQMKTQDEEGETVKYTEHSTEFWAYKVVQLLGNLPATYLANFLAKYDVDEKILTVGLEAIQKANNQKLYKYLASTLNSCKPLASTYLM